MYFINEIDLDLCQKQNRLNQHHRMASTQNQGDSSSTSRKSTESESESASIENRLTITDITESVTNPRYFTVESEVGTMKIVDEKDSSNLVSTLAVRSLCSDSDYGMTTTTTCSSISTYSEDEPCPDFTQSLENFELLKKVYQRSFMEWRPRQNCMSKHPPPGYQSKTFIFQRMIRGSHPKIECENNWCDNQNQASGSNDSSNRRRKRCRISFRRALKSALFAASIPLPPHNRRSWPYLKFKADPPAEDASELLEIMEPVPNHLLPIGDRKS